jgi:hypothetical protein
VVFAFARRDFGKSQKISVRIASFWAKTWTWDLPNTKQKCYLLSRDFWS